MDRQRVLPNTKGAPSRDARKEELPINSGRALKSWEASACRLHIAT